MPVSLTAIAMSVPAPESLSVCAAVVEERSQIAQSHDEFDAVLAAATRHGARALEVRSHACEFGPSDAMALAELARRVPALAALSLRCTGPVAGASTTFAEALQHSCRERGIAFAVHFVLDANADAFDTLAGRGAALQAGSLPGVLEASRRLQTAGVTVRWWVPLVPRLVPRLEALFSLARDEGVDPVVVPPPSLALTPGRSAEALDADERLFAWDFISYRLLEEEKDLHSVERLAGYRALRDMLSDAAAAAAPARTVPLLCAQRDAKDGRWALHHEDRLHTDPVFDDVVRSTSPRASPHAGRLREQAVDMGGVLFEGLLGAAQWARARLAGTPPASAGGSSKTLSRVLLIGAYGGEHIGDAAILGGVLFRIHRRYGTTGAILMSQRPAHTRHLIPMLATPFNIEVRAYEQAAIRACLHHVDAVVFAGGPLIDLPKQLVKHLYAASLARRHGKPFIIEGIGPGPFPRWPSEWTARRLVLMADRISLRTARVDSPLMRGLDPEPGRDPAFDYLETRGAPLGLLRDQDRRWIERLLNDSRGRLLVGLNLRPIRHLFTVGAPAGKRAEYTRDIEGRFEERLAEGMRQFQRSSPVPPCFVFFPMNAIQFGMSDLRSAYRIQRLLGSEVDFRVWEADASLDGVVALLRRLDIVITMRFHATIFALAQQRRVIGIDYRVGKRDKVGALLDDVGQGGNCQRIDEMTSAWLVERLTALSAAPPVPADVAASEREGMNR